MTQPCAAPFRSAFAHSEAYVVPCVANCPQYTTQGSAGSVQMHNPIQWALFSSSVSF
ncbi:hypothetical protein BV22DRAFT_1039323 [Leucogyrophana mollusca]|uniref:Uncharacterized protein n=1 Tax=Leucogyrophana mollusca TaxID=85980 RepID=A0ACB8B6H7_9AGAM|nr:hypothetical protein BV22DRAFT_1039323 [Leucogyrophana mollusca]